MLEDVVLNGVENWQSSISVLALAEWSKNGVWTSAIFSLMLENLFLNNVEKR